MALKVRCPGCEKVLTVPDTARGKAIRCPSCETKVPVPAASPAGKAKAAKPKAPAPDSGDAISTLDLRNVEDEDARICPKCGFDMSFYEEETTDCPKCGTDVTTGGLGEAARKKLLKGPDPDKFYASIWGSNWAYVWKHQVLVWRTLGYLTALSLLMWGSLFLYLYIPPWPPRAFFGLMTGVFALMMVGWLWFLDLEFVKASIERKDKMKRINLDIFLCGAIGFKWIVWHLAIGLPVLLLPGVVGWFVGNSSDSNLPLLIALAIGYLGVLPLFFIGSAHNCMPQPEPGFMIWKVLPAAFRLFKPLFLATILAITILLPAAGCLVTAGVLSGTELSTLIHDMDENTGIYRAKDLVEKTIKKEKEEAEKNPLSKMEYHKIEYRTLIFPLVMWFVALLLAVFPLVYLMRLNGQIVYFFRESMDLQALVREYKYVAKERHGEEGDEDEQPAKPKTPAQEVQEAFAIVGVCVLVGLVAGYVFSSVVSVPVVPALAFGVTFWGIPLAGIIAIGMLTPRLAEVSDAGGIVAGTAAFCMAALFIVARCLVMFMPWMLPYVLIPIRVVSLIGLVTYLASLVYGSRNYLHCRGPMVTIGLAILANVVAYTVMATGVVAAFDNNSTDPQIPPGVVAPAEGAPAQPAGQHGEGGAPAADPAAADPAAAAPATPAAAHAP